MQKLEKKTLKKKVEDWDSSFSALDRSSASPRLTTSSHLARRKLPRKYKGALNANTALSA